MIWIKVVDYESNFGNVKHHTYGPNGWFSGLAKWEKEEPTLTQFVKWRSRVLSYDMEHDIIWVGNEIYFMYDSHGFYEVFWKE